MNFDYKWIISVFAWSHIAQTLLWVFILMIVLSGCAHNPCTENPRNMQCMTPEEIEEALNA